MTAVSPNMTALETRLGSLGLDTPLPEISVVDVLTRPLDIYRAHLASLLAAALDCDISVAYAAIASSTDITLGDLSVVLPRLRLQTADLANLAVDVTSKLPGSPLLQLPYPDGVHLRIFFSPKTLPRLLLPYICERGSSYGGETYHGVNHDPTEPKKKIVVEYSSPNIGTDFTADHLRSTLIGEFVARTHESMGWDVIRLNYIGDWGKHIGLLAGGWQRFGSEELLQGDQALAHILDIYTKMVELFKPEQELSRQAKNDEATKAEIESKGIFAERDAFFKKMEDGDEEALALWTRWREVSISQFKASYERLGIQFDQYSGESKVKPETMAKVEADLREKEICEEIDGAWMVNFGKHGDQGKPLGTQPIRGRTGSTTYLLRDIAAALDREEAYSFDKMIYVVSARQQLHFQQVSMALELMGREDLAKKIKHVGFGGIQAMHTHLNAPRTLDAIIDGVKALMEGPVEQGGDGNEVSAAEPVENSKAIAGLLSQDMSTRRNQGYAFDPRRVRSTEGDSGLKLQHYHTKLSSCIADLRTAEVESTDPDYASLEDDTYADILRVMAQYPDIVSTTFKSLEPHGMLTYLVRLSDALSIALDEEELEADAGEAGPSSANEAGEQSLEDKRAHLVLFECAKQVLENGMRLLGFPMGRP